MSLDASRAENYAAAAKYASQIEQVYGNSSQGIDESKLLGELLKLIDKIPEDEHLFCNEHYRSVAVFCLTLFSFSNQGTIAWLKGRFDPVLGRCKDCVRHFTRGKCKMLQHFSVLRKVPYEHVTKFNNIVSLWRSQALISVIQGISVNNNTDINLTEEIKVAILECFCNPQVLRINETLKAAFDAVFKFLYNSQHPMLGHEAEEPVEKHVTAGLIYCWFEGTKEEAAWARSCLENLAKKEFAFTEDNFTQDLFEEINVHFLYLQNTSNFHEALVSHFWLKFNPIYFLLSPSLIQTYLVVPPNLDSLRQSIRHPIVSIYKLWYTHLAHNFREKPLAILLKVLRIFLEKVGHSFWSLIEPFTFHSILDLVFEKNMLSNALIKIQNNPLASQDFDALLIEEPSLTDLVSWTLPFYHSLSPPKRIQMVKKVSTAFIRVISSHPSLNPIPKACLINSSTALLSAVLLVTDKERAMLYSDESFETTLFTKLDSRALLNNDMVLNIVVQCATNVRAFLGAEQPISSVAYSATKVLASCIDYDILLLCQASYRIYREEKANDVKVSTGLLSKVIQHLDLGRSNEPSRLAALLLSSMRNVNGLLRPKTSDPSANQHNTCIRLYVDLLKSLLVKITDIPPSHLIKVLTDESGSRGFWSCIFTSDIEIYQTATNILYETFDVEGRLEGIQEMLKRNLSFSLESINLVLTQLTKHEFFEPCPRAIRVLMDIINVFSDPVNGTFANYASMKNERTDQILETFWSLSWKFLNMIYRATLKWASKYPYSELENFTKDTLDTSISLLEAYREFSGTLASGNDPKQSETLLNHVLATFHDMLYWLRLSDEYLLASCVKLIVKAADLAIEKGFKFDDVLVTTMTKYASKARKFSNKLTPQQSSELVSRAKEFNDKLVDKVTAEVDLYHKEKEKSNASVGSSSARLSPAPMGSKVQTSSPATSIESKVDFLQRKAMSSSLMGRPKSQAKITSFGTLKPGMSPSPREQQKAQPSKVELARRQLLAGRKVHPPSSNVFNSRKSQAQHNTREDSSDESEDDLEDAKELFSMSKNKERRTPIVLDINGKPIKKADSAERKKLEEENMRRRLNVDLNPFYEKVLKWKYTNSGEYPSNDQKHIYTDVKDTFKSAEDYQKVMQPLLLLECWQGLCAARDREENKPFSLVVGNRTAVSDFYEVYASVSKKLIVDAGITDSDLVVLSHFPSARNLGDVRADDFKTAENTCLAKVWGMKNNKGDNMDLTLRIDRSTQFSRFLTLRAEIFAVKVMQMTTVEREYAALIGLPFYDLVRQITSGNSTAKPNIEKREIEEIKANYNLNNSQAEAIASTVYSEGFSLIQGPPGTGKTKTILGIIGYFLSTQKLLPAGVIKQPVDVATSGTSTEQLLQKQKVLICAPSNAAVDELVLRLKGGVFDKNGKVFSPRLVRIGRSDAVNAAIKDLTLEEQVDKKLGNKNYEFAHDPNLEQNLQSALTERRQLRRKLDAEDGSASSDLSTDDITKIQMSIRELSRKINELGKQKDEIRERNSVNFRNKEVDRRKAQSRILAESEIICSTLSGSAHDILSSLGVKFDTVIIDEACQCTELSTIIPLRYGAKRCIMVGDPNQLPPTVLSGAASNFKYNQSLFVRMEKKCSPYLLNIQYRMHPAISKFPSSEFYKGKLSDGPEMEAVNSRPWHKRSPLGPYKFFDIATGRQEQNKKSMSFVNFEECRVAVELVENLLNHFENSYDFTGKIGIISPYREQMLTLKREFRRYFGNPVMSYVDFNTIDGFQGQEKEVIIISCVRADDTKSGVGFLKDFRRMNVALTRAKTTMWILGHHSSLFKNQLWKNLITDAKDRNCLELACSGFLNTNNLKAASKLKQYAGSHDHILGDGYDPTAPAVERSSKPYKNYQNDKENRSLKEKNRQQTKPIPQAREPYKKKPASGDHTAHTSKVESHRNEPVVSKEKASYGLSGTKKKSSIFGAPSIDSEIDIKVNAPAMHTKNSTKSDGVKLKGSENETTQRVTKSAKRVRFDNSPVTIVEKKIKVEAPQRPKADNGPKIYASKRALPANANPNNSSENSHPQAFNSSANKVTESENDSDQDGYDPSASPSLDINRDPFATDSNKTAVKIGRDKTLARSAASPNPFIPKRKIQFPHKR
ncbi:LAME_0E08416g1_1 [Lachancea meyersii CBS 8951]|uniref:LAME_0E08416g1_1 n=1 Tax=Lachancea meyersii CBS 8951 TaxID=1266667 RepID=A0A1G4JJ21_9SACH|nr:LAME_0E08416g1_1 [Lachancea meyersii CBS 8951]